MNEWQAVLRKQLNAAWERGGMCSVYWVRDAAWKWLGERVTLGLPDHDCAGFLARHVKALEELDLALNR